MVFRLIPSYYAHIYIYQASANVVINNIDFAFIKDCHQLNQFA